jgi:hypothetical protein
MQAERGVPDRKMQAFYSWRRRYAGLGLQELIVLRSMGSRIMRLTSIGFPSDLSVSSKVPLLKRLTKTMLNSGSPFEHEPNLNRHTVRGQS